MILLVMLEMDKNKMKIFTHSYRVIIFKNGALCWITKGWVLNKHSVSRLWRWNRFKTWYAHLGRDFKYNRLDQEHLNECKHCKKGFERWLTKKGDEEI